MVVYFMEFPDPKYPFFSKLSKFQQRMFKRIHGILTSFDGPTKIPNNRCLYVEVHCAVIEYKNEKTKPVHYLIQIVDFDDPNYQRQEWSPKRWELVTDPALTRAIGFYNIYHQNWGLIEQGKALMHCENSTFAYDSEFNEYMKVEGATSEDVFDYILKFLSEKRKKYLLELFEKRDPEHLQYDENFDDYPDNYDLEDIIRDKGMQDLNNND